MRIHISVTEQICPRKLGKLRIVFRLVSKFHLSSKLASGCNSVEGGCVELLIVVLGDDQGALRPDCNDHEGALTLSETRGGQCVLDHDGKRERSLPMLTWAMINAD